MPDLFCGHQKLKLMYRGLVQLIFDFKSNLGVMFGVNYRLPLGTNFGFQPELNWMTKGGKISESEFFDESSFNLNYLELPLYFLYTGGNSSGFYAGAGPAINFGISGKAKAGGQSENIEFGNEKASSAAI